LTRRFGTALLAEKCMPDLDRHVPSKVFYSYSYSLRRSCPAKLAILGECLIIDLAFYNFSFVSEKVGQKTAVGPD